MMLQVGTREVEKVFQTVRTPISFLAGATCFMAG